MSERCPACGLSVHPGRGCPGAGEPHRPRLHAPPSSKLGYVPGPVRPKHTAEDPSPFVDRFRGTRWQTPREPSALDLAARRRRARYLLLGGALLIFCALALALVLLAPVRDAGTGGAWLAVILYERLAG